MKHGRRADLRGKRFGRLVVIEEAPRLSPKRRLWKCRCDCGNIKVIDQQNLGGKVLACGCLQRERTSAANKTHGLSKTPEYHTWERMKNRCLNPNTPDFEEYGGRGITVCEEWRDDFEAFLASVGKRPSVRHSIDRIDNSKDYEPGNCRWATAKQQANNRRNRGYNRWHPKPKAE